MPYGASDLDGYDRITQGVKLSQNDLEKNKYQDFIET